MKRSTKIGLMLFTSTFFSACSPFPERDKSLIEWSKEDSVWVSADGKRLPFRIWDQVTLSEEFSPSIWIAIHGLGGSSDEFQSVARFLNKRNGILVAPDHRGMGFDPVTKERGDILNYQLWIEDLKDFLQLVHRHYPNREIYLHGESLGAVMALYLAPSIENVPIQGMVLSAPVVYFRGDVGFWKMQLFRILRYTMPKKRFALSDMGTPQEGENRLPSSRDPDVLEALKNSPARLQDYTIRMLYEAGQLIENAGKQAKDTRIPILILYAGQDVFIRSVVMETYIEKWEKAGVPIESAYFPESHHLLTRDYDREAVFAEWNDWWLRVEGKNGPSNSAEDL